MSYHVVSIPNCPLCSIAQNVLKAHNLEFTVELLDTDVKRNAFKKAHPLVKVMPQIYQDGVLIGSYSALKAWLA